MKRNRKRWTSLSSIAFAGYQALLLLSFASLAFAGAPSDQIRHQLKATIVVYRVGFTQCSVVLSTEGYGKGSVTPSCVLLDIRMIPSAFRETGFPFEVLYQVPTVPEDN